MTKHNTHFKLLMYVFSGIFLSISAAAATWYVDPVNGSDLYDGTSPFHIPDTPIGPTETLDAIMYQVGMYDIVVLADGVYSGELNTSPSIMQAIDSEKLYMVSANGPDNCTLELYEPASFSYYAPDAIETCFSGITFIGADQPDIYAIGVLNRCSVRFHECIFTNFYKYPDRGIILTANDSKVSFDACQFTSNQVQMLIRSESQGSVFIERSSFTENTNSYQYSITPPGGLVRMNESDALTVRDCTFTNNSSAGPYAMISIYAANQVSIEGCIIENNTATSNGGNETCYGIYCSDTTEVTVKNSRFENMRGYEGACVLAERVGSLALSDCQFNDNNAGLKYYYSDNNLSSNLDITDCDFIGHTPPDEYDINNPAYAGIFAEVYNNSHFPLQMSIQNCKLQSNNIGIHIRGELGENSHFEIKNCLITDNKWTGMGIPANIYLQTPSLIHNCTVANNYQYGVVAGNMTIENTIIRQESGIPLLEINGPLTLNYSNVQGGWGGSGVGNIDTDPLFVDPGIWHPDPEQRIAGTDYHLKSTAGRFDPVSQSWVQDDVDSPCIDTGNPADFAGGEPLSSGGRINMGVYGGTSQASKSGLCEGGIDGTGRMIGDVNHDCAVNLGDFVWIAGDWLQSTLIQQPRMN